LYFFILLYITTVQKFEVSTFFWGYFYQGSIHLINTDSKDIYKVTKR